jgi:hypothetical protein
MTMYVYSTEGEPRGFLFETTIYGMDGRPLGRLVGARVHRFDGSYVGEWFHQMVVERPTARPRPFFPATPPAARPPAPVTFRRRHVAEYGAWRDAFDLLAGEGAVSVAAE